MSYSKPSTPYVVIILIIFAITAFDQLIHSKSDPHTVEISIEPYVQQVSTPSPVYLTNNF